MLLFPYGFLLATLVMTFLFPVFNWMRHPTALPWLWALAISTGAAIVGTVLLFLAKLPQYSAGIFFQVGPRHLPRAQQRLYRRAFWLIIPSLFVLLALLFVAGQFN